MKLFYSPDYALSETDFDTTRKALWVARSLAERPIPGVELVAPNPVTEEDLLLIHQPPYVRAVQTGEPRSLAQSQGFPWDAKLWLTTTASTGGAVAAALTALTEGVAGSLSSGLHHACSDRGNGFCTFNGLALAALKALDAGAGSVLILDLDAHCGGGTHSLIGSHAAIRHTDISVSGFDGYTPAPRNTLDLVTSADHYLPTIRQRLEELDAEPAFGLCLYNAGMDPYGPEGKNGPGRLPDISAERLREREEIVFDWCRRRRIPIAFVLAGGYVERYLSQEALVNLHRLTLEAAWRISVPALGRDQEM
jgi:acetoin utilization deacetylase AcuC-like enzyme